MVYRERADSWSMKEIVMPKLTLFFFTALSTASMMLALPALGQDNVIANCAQQRDKEIAQDLVNNDFLYRGHNKGLIDRNSTNPDDPMTMIGGGNPVCRQGDSSYECQRGESSSSCRLKQQGETAYVCLGEKAVYCVNPDFKGTDRNYTFPKKIAGKNKSEREKGPDDSKDPFRQCDFPTNTPLKNMVAPEQWGGPVANQSSDLRKSPDAFRCGFAQGAGRMPCSYLYVFHNVSKADVENLQKKIIDKENHNAVGFNCRSGQHSAVYSLVDDGIHSGESFRFQNQWPDGMGERLPVSITTPVPPPPPPPLPVTPCNNIDWRLGLDCNDWAQNQCDMQKPAPRMRLCSCNLKDCQQSLEQVASQFSDLGSGASNAKFFAMVCAKEPTPPSTVSVPSEAP